MSQRYLIITADDLGYSEERNIGICECFQSSSITRSSLLVNGVAAQHAVSLIDFSKYPVGLHINLTEGKPISEVSLIKSIVDDAGVFYKRDIFFQRIKKFNTQEVEIEMTNQIESFIKLTNGQLPNHIDGHQHVHIVPGIIEILVKIMKKYHIKKTRLPLESMALEYTWTAEYENKDFYNLVLIYCVQASLIFKENNIIFPNFIGQSLIGKNMLIGRLQFLIESSYPIQSLINNSEIPSNYISTCDSHTIIDSYGKKNIEALINEDEINYNYNLDVISKTSDFSGQLSNKKYSDFKNKLIFDDYSFLCEHQKLNKDTSDLLFDCDKLNISCNVLELMCHPGYMCKDAIKGGCGIGADDFSLSSDRVHELHVLQSIEMKLFYEKNQIMLSF